LFTITLTKVASLGGEYNPNFTPSFPSAEEFWKVFIYTSGLDSSGDSLGPFVFDTIGGLSDVNAFVEDKVASICALIDWSQQGEFSPLEDRSAPVIAEQFPSPGQTNVTIVSPVVIRVRDLLPGVGIDASTVQLKIDGYTVNPSVTGNKYDYTFVFVPRPIFN
jgi:hypothetical protein